MKERAAQALASVWKAFPPQLRRRVLFATNHHFLVGVVGLVRNEQGEVLVLEHRFRTPFRWGLPGGFINHGESFEAALIRELHEEVRLDVKPERVVDTGHSVDGRYLSVGLTAVAPHPETLTLTENYEIVGGGFYPPDAPPPGMYPHHARLLERFGRNPSWGLADDPVSS